MTVFPKWYVYNHANPVEAGTAYEILPGSVAANATAWGCQGQDCPNVNGRYRPVSPRLSRFHGVNFMWTIGGHN